MVGCWLFRDRYLHGVDDPGPQCDGVVHGEQLPAVGEQKRVGFGDGDVVSWGDQLWVGLFAVLYPWDVGDVVGVGVWRVDVYGLVG